MVSPTKEKRQLAEVPAALARLLDVPVRNVRARVAPSSGLADQISAGGLNFVVEWVGSPTGGPVAAAADRALQRRRVLGKAAVPLVAVPFMGEAGRRACEAAGVAWLDLSGNARIVAPRLRIIVAGQPNRFRSPGRPASLFAPKSARVSRWLLAHPGQTFTQREIARSTGMTEGYVSRVAGRLERDGYVTREPSGALRTPNPATLLDAWLEAYQFSKHTFIHGHLAARSGDALARFVSDTLVAENIVHAATGLAAAWQMTHFVAFRMATIYVAVEPSAEVKGRLGFREEVRGANLRFVVPNDAGVFQGAREREGVRCVHPVQAYLDLKGQPERAADAAERLRVEIMKWAPDA